MFFRIQHLCCFVQNSKSLSALSFLSDKNIFRLKQKKFTISKCKESFFSAFCFRFKNARPFDRVLQCHREVRWIWFRSVLQFQLFPTKEGLQKQKYQIENEITQVCAKLLFNYAEVDNGNSPHVPPQTIIMRTSTHTYLRMCIIMRNSA